MAKQKKIREVANMIWLWRKTSRRSGFCRISSPQFPFGSISEVYKNADFFYPRRLDYSTNKHILERKVVFYPWVGWSYTYGKKSILGTSSSSCHTSSWTSHPNSQNWHDEASPVINTYWILIHAEIWYLIGLNSIPTHSHSHSRPVYYNYPWSPSTSLLFPFLSWRRGRWTTYTYVVWEF
jgi:hypothetical protein